MLYSNLFAILFLALSDLSSKKVENEPYKDFKERLKTFHSWPIDFVKAKDLANDGFIYSGQKDLVACIYCDTKLDCWESGDSVTKAHRYQSGSCPFVMAMYSLKENDGIYRQYSMK